MKAGSDEPSRVSQGPEGAAESGSCMTNSEELRAGCQAAAECVEALRELQLASATQNRQNPADYRPHLRRLFRAVRSGFEPISRCWQGILDVFAPPGSEGSSQSTRPVAPVGAWQSAVLVFWQVVCYTPVCLVRDRFVEQLGRWV